MNKQDKTIPVELVRDWVRLADDDALPYMGSRVIEYGTRHISICHCGTIKVIEQEEISNYEHCGTNAAGKPNGRWTRCVWASRKAAE